MINRKGVKVCTNHANTDAVSYCKKCKKYMCAKCKEMHDGFFVTEHESAIESPEHAEGPAYASLRWGNNEQFDGYTVPMRKEGGEWSYGTSSFTWARKAVASCQRPGVAYEFRVMGSAKGTNKGWSEALSVRTEARTNDPYVKNAVRGLEMNLGDTDMCVVQPNNIFESSNKGKPIRIFLSHFQRQVTYSL